MAKMLLQLGEETYSIAPKDDDDAGDEVPYGSPATFTPEDESCHYFAVVMDPDIDPETCDIQIYRTPGPDLDGKLIACDTEAVDVSDDEGGGSPD